MVDERSSRRAAHEADWLPAVQQALGRLDDRARTILAERVFKVGGSIPTLQELGDRFKLSRERVRQIEAAAVKELLRDVTSVRRISVTKWRSDQSPALATTSAAYSCRLIGSRRPFQ